MPYYNYTDIEPLLSAQAKAYLKVVANYTELAGQASDTIFEITGLQENDSHPWLKMPFVWLLDYYASNTAAGVSPEQLTRTKENYKMAIDALEQHVTSDSTNPPRIGTIDVPYY